MGYFVTITGMLLALLVIFCAIYFWWKKPDALENDPKPMTLLLRRVVLIYLMLLGALLVALIIDLNMVNFPEAAVTIDLTPPPAAPTPIPTPTPTPKPGSHASPTPTLSPTPTPTPATGTEPRVLQVIPRTTSGAAPTVYLAVYGENFVKDKSLVRFNGTVRPTAYIGAGTTLLEAQPETASIADQGTIAVDVTTEGKVSNAIVISIERPKAKLNLGFCYPLITREVQLLLIVLVAGALGCLLHALQSITDFIGNRDAIASWFWWYITRPLMGMALALIFYAVLRGGFLAGAPADAKAISPFGVLAIGALVGMFTDKATQKLADVFDVLVKVDPKRADPLTASGKLAIKMDKFPGGKLPDGTLNTDYSAVTLEAQGGAPPYTWSETGLAATAGMSIDKGTGKISGKPTATVTDQKVTITVTDKNNATATQAFTITVK